MLIFFFFFFFFFCGGDHFINKMSFGLILFSQNDPDDLKGET